MTKRVALFVPGIMGSELWHEKELVWPGPVSELKLPYTRMSLLMRTDLVVGDVIRRIWLKDVYAGLIDDLETCGFSESGDLPTLICFAYDWRSDNRLAAAQLADLLTRCHDQHHGDVEFTIVAHSMGGLVARYMLESGAHSASKGVAAVRNVFFMGTPHRGAPLALMAALGEEPRLWLNAAQVKQLASSPAFPALYQLLPPVGEPFVWAGRDDARLVPRDLRQEASSLGLARENLEHANAFRSGINPTQKPEFVRYFLFFGSSHETPSAIELRMPGQDQYLVKRMVEKDAGDGTVPTWSGMLTGHQVVPVSGAHDSIFRNSRARSVLGTLLGRPGLLAAPGAEVEIDLREEVVPPDSVVHLQLELPPNTTVLSGRVEVERSDLDADGDPTPWDATGISHPISFDGVAVDRIDVNVAAPPYPGLYRYRWHAKDGSRSSRTAALFVQGP